MALRPGRQQVDRTVTGLVVAAALLAAAAVALTSVAAVRSSAPAWWAVSGVPVVVAGLAVRVAGADIGMAERPAVTLAGVLMVGLGVVGGGPLAEWTIARAEPPPPAAGAEPQVLRGGATIGVLERLAVVAAVGLGRFEIVAAVIAVKGLGRFRDLATSAAREQFIIGTLVSLLWAGVCAAIVWPGGL